MAAPASANLVDNAGFESGTSGWIDYGNTSVDSGQASSGAAALRVGTGAGGAGQEVGGIVPGDTYRLTAQAKVNAASEIVYIGVNFIDASGAPFTQNSVVVDSTSYTTATLDVVAPPNAVRALVYVWKNAGTGLALVDDFALQDVGRAVPTVVASDNLLFNGGFETPGFVGWQSFANRSTPLSPDAAAGAFAARIGTSASGIGQQVPGFAPGTIVAGTTYRVSARAKVSTPGEIGYLGVMFEDGNGAGLLAQNAVFRSTTYATVQADVTAPANATRALVFAWKNAGDGFILVDEVSLVQVAPVPPGTEPPPSPLPTVQLSASPERLLDTRPGSHRNPSIARLANGTYASAWLLPETSAPDAVYRVCWDISRADASGITVGPSNCLQQPQAASSGLTHVLTRPDGGFVVVWNDASDLGVRSQAFDASGTPVGGVQVGPQQPVDAAAAALAGGGYVLLSAPPAGQNTTTSTISFQRYSSDGTPIGSPTSVGDSGGNILPAKVVPLTGGGFAVAWLQGGTTATVMTRMFTADGTPVGDPVMASGVKPVCTDSPDPRIGRSCQFQNIRALAPMDDGGYAVVWVNGFGRAAIVGTFARRFGPDGTPGATVGKLADRDLLGAVMAPNGADAFVFGWLEDRSGRGDDIIARVFDATPLR